MIASSCLGLAHRDFEGFYPRRNAYIIKLLSELNRGYMTFKFMIFVFPRRLHSVF